LEPLSGEDGFRKSDLLELQISNRTVCHWCWTTGATLFVLTAFLLPHQHSGISQVACGDPTLDSAPESSKAPFLRLLFLTWSQRHSL